MPELSVICLLFDILIQLSLLSVEECAALRNRQIHRFQVNGYCTYFSYLTFDIGSEWHFFHYFLHIHHKICFSFFSLNFTCVFKLNGKAWLVMICCWVLYKTQFVHRDHRALSPWASNEINYKSTFRYVNANYCWAQNTGKYLWVSEFMRRS